MNTFTKGFTLGIASALVLLALAAAPVNYMTPTQTTNAINAVAPAIATNAARYWVTNVAYLNDTNIVNNVALPNDTNHVNFRFYAPQLTNANLTGVTTMTNGYLNSLLINNSYVTNSFLSANWLTVASFMQMTNLSNSINTFRTLGVDSNGYVVMTNSLPAGTNFYSTNGGNGTTDYLVKWGNETNLTDSVIYDTGDPGIQVNGLARIQSDDNQKFAVTDAAGTTFYIYMDHGTKTLKVNNGYFIDFASAGSGGVFSFNTTTQNASGYLKVYVGGSVQYIPTYSSP